MGTLALKFSILNVLLLSICKSQYIIFIGFCFVFIVKPLNQLIKTTIVSEQPDGLYCSTIQTTWLASPGNCANKIGGIHMRGYSQKLTASADIRFQQSLQLIRTWEEKHKPGNVNLFFEMHVFVWFTPNEVIDGRTIFMFAPRLTTILRTNPAHSWFDYSVY